MHIHIKGPSAPYQRHKCDGPTRDELGKSTRRGPTVNQCLTEYSLPWLTRMRKG
jgi:hypothetical protein